MEILELRTDIRIDLKIPNKMANIIKKEKFKWFGHVVHKDNASYLYKNQQKTQRMTPKRDGMI